MGADHSAARTLGGDLPHSTIGEKGRPEALPGGVIRTSRAVGRRRSSYEVRSTESTARRLEFFSVVLSRLFTRVAAGEALHFPISLFPRRISDGHALCINAAMLKILHRLKILRRQATSMELGPTFASDAEIELAARLRQQLEERYFEPVAEPSSPKNRSGKND